MYRFASNGEMGEPCGMPRRLSRASVVRVFLPRSSVSSTGHSEPPMSARGQKPALPRRSIAVRFAPNKQTPTERVQCDAMCRVEMWRGGCRSNISVSASFVWRCLSGATMTPFPHPSHRTGHEDFPHPALGQDFTPSPTARRAQAGTGARARSTRKGARVDTSRPCVA